MISDYCRADMPIVNSEQRETVKDILSETDTILTDAYELLCQMFDALIGSDEHANLPDMKDATMMGTLIKQRAQANNIRSLVAHLKERLY